ncbi:MAG: TIGR04282 family arsenosugar biosynthesis glycosyltransferase [Verrucomicrobia bacterium]|nr:TIGR04282 family arsenosugar biosynthesis glycosyltransferase [Verrucomicrobiota bacterium]
MLQSGQVDLQKLIIFIKAPRRGEVKTRLARDIGDEAACEAYCTLVDTLLNQLAELPEVELRVTPDDASAEIKPWLRSNWQLRPQGQGSLGERLQTAFTDSFNRGAERVVIIGSDCPFITADDIHDAWTALHDSEVVIGPACDGGYWLIGLRQLQPTLFDGIAWSTETVFRETLQRAEAARLRVQVLRELSDVDTEADWRAFLAATPEA